MTFGKYAYALLRPLYCGQWADNLRQQRTTQRRIKMFMLSLNDLTLNISITSIILPRCWTLRWVSQRAHRRSRYIHCGMAGEEKNGWRWRRHRIACIQRHLGGKNNFSLLFLTRWDRGDGEDGVMEDIEIIKRIQKTRAVAASTITGNKRG